MAKEQVLGFKSARRLEEVDNEHCERMQDRERGDLKKSITNIASECRIANIVRDHATILVDDATPKPDEIFGKDRGLITGLAGSNRDRVHANRDIEQTSPNDQADDKKQSA
jgi:hypothetical protein